MDEENDDTTPNRNIEMQDFKNASTSLFINSTYFILH
jgi:hypothetical protein